MTNTGATIVSTQNGQLVLSDGSRVAPEALGAKTNSDKTISVTKADGTTTTLPETGEAQNVLGLLGSALLESRLGSSVKNKLNQKKKTTDDRNVIKLDKKNEGDSHESRNKTNFLNP